MQWLKSLNNASIKYSGLPIYENCLPWNNHYVGWSTCSVLISFLFIHACLSQLINCVTCIVSMWEITADFFEAMLQQRSSYYCCNMTDQSHIRWTFLLALTPTHYFIFTIPHYFNFLTISLTKGLWGSEGQLSIQWGCEG